jgi:hypothetical protein
VGALFIDGVAALGMGEIDVVIRPGYMNIHPGKPQT